MNILIVLCHPDENSFTYQVYRKFTQGLINAGHNIILSDLYKQNFKTDLSKEEYLRETNYYAEQPLAKDVQIEQSKIQNSDAIVLIYPVFWTEAPAKLVGWFDRVWTSGFAYNPHPQMKTLEKALIIACAGKSIQTLTETGERAAMETVMLGDHIRNRAKEKEMVILDDMTNWNKELRAKKLPIHLQNVYQLGIDF
ncbi:MAG: flavodoxin family protein [Lachnospiraceae bacterium]|nr:flavodoxin family protein [Lachnospiraceae bacterium]